MHIGILNIGAALLLAALPQPANPSAGEKAIEQHLQPHLNACASGHAASCLHLSHRLNFLTNDREMQLIAVSLRKGCDAKTVDACAGLAVVYDTNAKLRPAGQVPKAMLDAACKANSAFACGQLAEMTLKEAQDNKAKVAKAQALAKRFCDRNGGYACYLVAQALAAAPANTAKAVQLFQKSCDAKDAIACYQLGVAHSQGYLGLGVDQTKATAAYRVACELDMGQACFNWAWQFLRGTGAPRDDAQAMSLLEKSCMLGDASGCDELDRRKPNPEHYCDLWGAEACFNLASKLSREQGETAEAAESITSAAMRACFRRHQGACRTLKHLAKDMTRHCGAGQNVRDSCMFASLVYEHGLLSENVSSVDGSNDVGSTLKKSCAAGAKVACTKLQRRLQAGAH